MSNSPTLSTIEVRIKAVSYEAECINAYDLRLPDGGALPPFKAGAHIDLKLSNGAVRSYSLVNPEHERHRYVVAVALDEASTGGSRHIHGRLLAGNRLVITPPVNDFALIEDAPHSVLIAGGIGITPIWCMVQRLAAINLNWQLHYAARTRAAAAFLEEIAALRGNVQFHFDAEADGKVLDVAAIVNTAPTNAHLYCCGPVPMLEAFEAASRGWARKNVHVEYFKARDAPARSGGYTVVLAKSNKQVLVPAGKTILDAMIAAGLDPARSCTEGVCGACEVRVLEGIPDHRDLVLTESERAANQTMMICCSGSKSETLVLDI